MGVCVSTFMMGLWGRVMGVRGCEHGSAVEPCSVRFVTMGMGVDCGCGLWVWTVGVDLSGTGDLSGWVWM